MVARAVARVGGVPSGSGAAGRRARAGRCAAKKDKPRGPGSAPLRMETDDQRKFGYGGDDLPPGGGYGGGDDGKDDGWRPGGDAEGPSPIGLAVLLGAGAFAWYEYKRPGGYLNKESKRDKREAFKAQRREEMLERLEKRQETLARAHRRPPQVPDYGSPSNRS